MFDPETVRCNQMILLAQQDYTAVQIATMVLRSDDTVLRVLKRFRDGGLLAASTGRLYLVYAPHYEATRIERFW